MQRVVIGFLAFAAVSALVTLAHAQENESLKAEIRLLLEEQARVEQLSPQAFEELVTVIAQEAAASGITVERLDEARDFPPDTLGESEGELFAEDYLNETIGDEESYRWIFFVGGFLLLVVGVVVFRKMQHGGAFAER